MNRQLLDHAAEHQYGVPAFNVNNMEQMQSIMQAADETDSPVIMQGSAGARSYAGEPFLRHLISAAIEDESPMAIVDEGGRRIGVVTRADLLTTVIEGTETS